jgi:hypothetical protein
MTIGTSLLVIAAGAILKYAVTTNVEGFDIHTAGLVLMIVGGLGLVLGVYFLLRGRPPDVPPPPL